MTMDRKHCTVRSLSVCAERQILRFMVFREYEMGRVYDTDGRQRNSFRSDVEDKKSESLNRFKRRWEYIIETGLKKTGWYVMEWIHVPR